MFQGALGTSSKIAQTLEVASPLMFTGLAAAFAYKCGVFNLGGEGQFIIGSVVSIAVSTQLGITGAPAILLSLIAGTLAGGFGEPFPEFSKLQED